VATYVQRDVPRQSCIKRRHTVDSDVIMQERAKLEGSLRNTSPAFAKGLGVLPHVHRATARDDNDPIVCRKGLDKRLEYAGCVRFEPRIRKWLPTTCGPVWYDDRDPQTLEHTQCSDRDLGVQLIDVAWREQSDRHAAIKS
jgi:hypothetical protein